MKATVLLFLLLGSSSVTSEVSAHGRAVSAAGPYFVENKGQVTNQYLQIREDIDFHLSDRNVDLFVGKAALHYQWVQPIDSLYSERYRMDVRLLGANTAVQPLKEQKQHFREHYYLPHLGIQGATAFSYTKIIYPEVYPNIDWVLYIQEGSVEYDFVVRPGGNIADIRIAYNGATRLQLNADGSLTATTPLGNLTEQPPRSFLADGTAVATQFVLNGSVLGFNTAAYSGTLTIDPVLRWSTYCGGGNEETTRNGCISGDPYGNAYLCGYTLSSSNIATTGSFKDTLTTGGSSLIDAFLVRFNSAGVKTWATYYGGGSADYGTAVICDTQGNIFLTGYTNSTGLSSAGSHQPAGGGGTDAFLVKFDSSGARLWATYYGGTATEQALAISCDASSNVYIGGYTNNSTTGIATTAAHQTTGGGGNDAFVVKFDRNGARLWGTYYGGSSIDQCFALTCDMDKNVFVAGYTQSVSGIASSGAYQTTNAGGQDVFLVKLDSNGKRIWSTYYGGRENERCNGIITDHAGNSYITGYTLSSSGIASSGALQEFPGSSAPFADGFVSKFNSAGGQEWGTYYGGTGDESANAISYDGMGSVYIAGNTSSKEGIATSGTLKDTLDLADAFVLCMDTSGRRIWATYFGGEDIDQAQGIFCSRLSKIYLGGQSRSLEHLATEGASQEEKGGGIYDAFLAFIDDCRLETPGFISGKDTVCRGISYTYSVAPLDGAISYNWLLPEGWSGYSNADTINIVAGKKNDTLKVSANFVCGTSPEVIKVVSVSPLPEVLPSGIQQFCSGDSIVLSTVGGMTFQWLNGGSALGGATKAAYSVHRAGSYAVIVTNSIGCTDTSASDTVLVHPLPLPVISVSGAELSTGSFSSYQWLHNDVPVTGAVHPNYTIAVMSGSYTVRVTDSNGCTGTSAPYDAVPLLSGEPSVKAQWSLYPNPTADFIHLYGMKPGSGGVRVTLSSMEGKILQQLEQADRIDLRSYADGLYLLRLSSNDDNVIMTTTILKKSGQ